MAFALAHRPGTTTRGPRTDGSAAEVTPPRRRPESLGADALRVRWRLAFDAAERALSAGSLYLPRRELRAHSERLAGERQPTARLLQQLAHDQRIAAPLLHVVLSASEARRLLRLPADVAACVLNLDGVLIGSAEVHATAWAETFEDFLVRRVERTGGSFAPFSPRLDYGQHLHGRPRLEGVRSFLASRGIRLPEGEPDDPPWLETVRGLANHKRAALLRLLEREGVSAYDGAREYLETARDAGIGCAVVSASANTATILERAGLAGLVDASVDGNTIVAEALRARPQPDVLLAACGRLGEEPRHVAAFETSAPGIAAARAAGCRYVVGVGRGDVAASLRAAGADRVVSGLDELLDGR